MEEVTQGLYRGTKLEAFSAIKDGDVDVVINLETETREVIFGGANDELILCLENYVKLLDFAFSGYFPPSIDDSLAVVNQINYLIKRRPGTVILVHCRRGKERTGFIIALCRILLEGWSIDRAISEWGQKGCNPLWILFWARRLRECARVIIKE